MFCTYIVIKIIFIKPKPTIWPTLPPIMPFFEGICTSFFWKLISTHTALNQLTSFRALFRWLVMSFVLCFSALLRITCWCSLVSNCSSSSCLICSSLSISTWTPLHLASFSFESCKLNNSVIGLREVYLVAYVKHFRKIVQLPTFYRFSSPSFLNILLCQSIIDYIVKCIDQSLWNLIWK